MHPLLSRTPTQLAFAGDWHGDANWANGVIMSLAARGVEVVVQVGDFGVWPGWQGRDFLASVDKVARRRDVNVLFIDGNHDDHDQLDAAARVDGLGKFGERIWHVPRGTRWDWAGIRFAALGGATSVDRQSRTPGQSWWPAERISADDVKNFQRGGVVDVAVTHDCPAGVRIPGVTHGRGVKYWGYGPIVEAEEHRQVLAGALSPTSPALIVHGHYHLRYSGVWHYEGGHAEVEGLHYAGKRLTSNNVLITTPAELAERVGQIRLEDNLEQRP